MLVVILVSSGIAITVKVNSNYRKKILNMSKCPQCTKEISPMTEICPVCKCNLKEYYSKKLEEIEWNFDLKRLYEEVTPPTEPHREIPDLTKAILGVLVVFVLYIFINGFVTYGSINDTLLYAQKFIYAFGVGVLALLFSLRSNSTKYDEELLEYEMYQKRPEDYKIMKALEAYKLEQKYATPTVQCPYCKSTNVVKITSAGRIVSVATIGLASGNMGKQWHCRDCKSNF